MRSYCPLEAKILSRILLKKFKVLVSIHVAGIPLDSSNSSLKTCSVAFFGFANFSFLSWRFRINGLLS